MLLVHSNRIVNYHLHDSLLENIEEDKLTEDERKAAWEDYENEKKGRANLNINCEYICSDCLIHIMYMHACLDSCIVFSVGSGAGLSTFLSIGIETRKVIENLINYGQSLIASSRQTVQMSMLEVVQKIMEKVSPIVLVELNYPMHLLCGITIFLTWTF